MIEEPPIPISYKIVTTTKYKKYTPPENFSEAYGRLTPQ